jgi:hypothetical protein
LELSPVTFRHEDVDADDDDEDGDDDDAADDGANCAA